MATRQWKIGWKEATKDESHERQLRWFSTSNRAPAGHAPATARARVHAQSRSGGGDGVASGETNRHTDRQTERRHV